MDELALKGSFYRTKSGNEPVREWLRDLPKHVRHEIGTDIAAVQRTWPVGRPLVGQFGSGLYEVVTTVGRNEYRVFFCIVGSVMVFLHGVQKKTQKTPASDVTLARARQKEVSR
jgi:phage-related protein